VLGKPVENVPREGIRAIAQATGNWPVSSWFTALGLPEDVSERWTVELEAAGVGPEEPKEDASKPEPVN